MLAFVRCMGVCCRPHHLQVLTCMHKHACTRTLCVRVAMNENAQLTMLSSPPARGSGPKAPHHQAPPAAAGSLRDCLLLHHAATPCRVPFKCDRASAVWYYIPLRPSESRGFP